MRLPARPLVFVAVYVLLTIFMVEPTVMGWPGSIYAACFGFSAIIALHCLWMAQLVEAADRHRQQRLGSATVEKRPDLFRTLIVGLPLAVAVGLLASIFVPPLAGLVGPGFALLFLVLTVLTARRFCREERESGLGSLGVFLTSVLIFYSAIGAFVLAPRFKRVEALSQPEAGAVLGA